MQKGISEILDSVFPQLSRPFKILLIFLLAGFSAYANAIQNPFVHDDVVFILQNPDIADLNGVWSVFTEPFWLAPQTSVINPYHRPLLEVVYRLEFALFGYYPQGYHFLNILLHIGNTFLLFTVLEKVIKRTAPALMVSLIFLLHPVQSEAVACISGISNLLSGFFALLSFYFFLSSEGAEGGKGKFLRAAGSVVFFIFGLLAKEQVIVLPFILFFYVKFMSERKDRPAKEKYLLPCALTMAALAFVVLRKFAVGQGVPNIFGHPLELGMRLLAIPETLLIYLRILVWPSDLHYYRSLDTLSSSVMTPFYFFVVIVAVWLVILRTRRPEKNHMLWGAAWFMTFLLPVLNILPLIIEYSHITIAEHFLYLPMAGVAVFLVTAVQYLIGKTPERQRRNIVVGLISFIIIFMAGMTLKQNTYWRSEVALFERTVRYEKKMARIYLLMAKAYFFEGNLDAAIDAYAKAGGIVDYYLRIPMVPMVRQYYAGLARDIRSDMAYCLLRKGEFFRAATVTQEAQKIQQLYFP